MLVSSPLQVLQKLGKADETRDAAFEEMVANFNKQMVRTHCYFSYFPLIITTRLLLMQRINVDVLPSIFKNFQEVFHYNPIFKVSYGAPCLRLKEIIFSSPFRDVWSSAHLVSVFWSILLVLSFIFTLKLFFTCCVCSFRQKAPNCRRTWKVTWQQWKVSIWSK